MPGTFSFNHTLTDQTYYPDVPSDGTAARQQFMDLLNAVKDNMNNVLAQGSDVSGLAGTGRTTETVKGNADSLNAHLADFVRNPAYGPTAGGTGTPNAYTFASTPALPALVDGVSAYLDVNVANTGAATLNWDGKGAKPIVDSKGNALIAGKLPLNGIVGVRYNASTGNFQLLGEGGDYGTALAGDVRNTKTFGTNNGVIPGTLDLSLLIPSNLLAGVTVDGVVGAAKRSAKGTGNAVSGSFTLTGLSFTPGLVVVNIGNGPTYNEMDLTVMTNGNLLFADRTNVTSKTNRNYFQNIGSSVYYNVTVQDANNKINTDGFKVSYPGTSGSPTVNWWAFELV